MHRDNGDEGRCRSIGTPRQRRGAAAAALSAVLLAPTAAAQAKRVFELAAETTGDWFGRVEWVGDLDGDGFDDFVVGAPEADVDLDDDGSIGPGEVAVGVAHCYSGRHATTPLRTWHGDRSQDNFGSEIAALGDLDRDGVADFGIAAPSTLLSGQRAYVRIVSGRSLRDPGVPELLGDIEDDADRDSSGEADGWQGDLGTALAAAGDVDRDGHPDLLVAGAGEYHWAMLVSGRSLQPLRSWDVHPIGPRDGNQSTAVASFGRDLNGDQQIELVIGNYAWSDPSTAECGAVWIYSGMNGIPLRTYRGSRHHDWFGYAIHVVPDLSGDPAAKPELLVGAPGTYRNDYGTAENGNYVAMWFGEALGTRVLELRGETVGAAPGSFFGAQLASGDYFADNASGLPLSELFVAARHHSEKRGLIACFEYAAMTPAWQPRWTLEGRERADKLGRISARGRLTTSLLEPDRPDAGDDLLVGTAHINGADGRELGHVWCFSAADGVDASSSIRGSGWAGDDLDPSLVPTIDLAAPPLLGTSARVRVACSLEPSTLGLLLVGLGDATTPETPHLLVSDYLVRPFVMNGVAGVIDVEVPADPALFATGKRYFAQAVLALPGVEGGIGYTPLVEAVVGGLDW